MVKLCFTLQLNRIVTNDDFDVFDAADNRQMKRNYNKTSFFFLRFDCGFLCKYKFECVFEAEKRGLLNVLPVAQCNNRNWLLFKLLWGSAVFQTIYNILPFQLSTFFSPMFDATVEVLFLTILSKHLFLVAIIFATVHNRCEYSNTLCYFDFIGHKQCRMVFVCQMLNTRNVYALIKINYFIAHLMAFSLAR